MPVPPASWQEQDRREQSKSDRRRRTASVPSPPHSGGGGGVREKRPKEFPDRSFIPYRGKRPTSSDEEEVIKTSGTRLLIFKHLRIDFGIHSKILLARYTDIVMMVLLLLSYITANIWPRFASMQTHPFLWKYDTDFLFMFILSRPSALSPPCPRVNFFQVIFFLKNEGLFRWYRYPRRRRILRVFIYKLFLHFPRWSAARMDKKVFPLFKESIFLPDETKRGSLVVA